MRSAKYGAVLLIISLTVCLASRSIPGGTVAGLAGGRALSANAGELGQRRVLAVKATASEAPHTATARALHRHADDSGTSDDCAEDPDTGVIVCPEGDETEDTSTEDESTSEDSSSTEESSSDGDTTSTEGDSTSDDSSSSDADKSSSDDDTYSTEDESTSDDSSGSEDSTLDGHTHSSESTEDDNLTSEDESSGDD